MNVAEMAEMFSCDAPVEVELRIVDLSLASLKQMRTIESVYCCLVWKYTARSRDNGFEWNPLTSYRALRSTKILLM